MGFFHRRHREGFGHLFVRGLRWGFLGSRGGGFGLREEGFGRFLPGTQNLVQPRGRLLFRGRFLRRLLGDGLQPLGNLSGFQVGDGFLFFDRRSGRFLLCLGFRFGLAQPVGQGGLLLRGFRFFRGLGGWGLARQGAQQGRFGLQDEDVLQALAQHGEFLFPLFHFFRFGQGDDVVRNLVRGGPLVRDMGRVRVHFDDAVPVALGFVLFTLLAQEAGHDPVGRPVIGQYPQEAGGHLHGLFVLAHPLVDLAQEAHQVITFGVFFQQGLQFHDGLRIQAGAHVNAGQGGAGGMNARGRNPFPFPIETLQFLLHQQIGGLHLKGPFHVPDGGLQVAFLFSNDAQGHVGQEVVRDRGEQTQEDVQGVAILPGLQKGLTHHPVRVQIFGEVIEHMAGLQKGLLIGFLGNQVINVANQHS